MHYGGAGLYGNCAEYTRVLTVLLNQGKDPQTGTQLLKPETVDELYRHQLDEKQLKGLQTPIPAVQPELTNPVSARFCRLQLPFRTPSRRPHAHNITPHCARNPLRPRRSSVPRMLTLSWAQCGAWFGTSSQWAIGGNWNEDWIPGRSKDHIWWAGLCK